MTKKDAIIGCNRRFYRGENTLCNRNCTFASQNKSKAVYWSNPNFAKVENDWYVICNNQHCKKIYLYYLPRGSVTRDDFKIRLDKDCFHIEIDCNDENVACQMSGFGFKNYFVGEMLYSEIEA